MELSIDNIDLYTEIYLSTKTLESKGLIAEAEKIKAKHPEIFRNAETLKGIIACHEFRIAWKNADAKTKKTIIEAFSANEIITKSVEITRH